MVDIALLLEWDNESIVVHHNTKAECDGRSDLRDKVYRRHGNIIHLLWKYASFMEHYDWNSTGDVQHLFHIEMMDTNWRSMK